MYRTYKVTFWDKTLEEMESNGHLYKNFAALWRLNEIIGYKTQDDDGTFTSEYTFEIKESEITKEFKDALQHVLKPHVLERV